MKTCTMLALSTAVVALLSLDSAAAMKTYLKKFPNGESVAFTQALGHVSDDDTGLNDFGTLFSGEGNEYTETLCKSTFPGTSMTVGAAFGDPCCTWKSGGTPDFTVDAAFTVPTKQTECAATATTTPAPTTAAPATTTATPSSGSSSAATSTPTTTSPTVTPASTPAASAKKSKCGVKKSANATRSSSDDDGSDDDY